MLLGELIVVVTTADEFTVERPEVLALPPAGCLWQTLVQQMDKEQRGQLSGLLAHGDAISGTVDALDACRSSEPAESAHRQSRAASFVTMVAAYSFGQ